MRAVAELLAWLVARHERGRLCGSETAPGSDAQATEQVKVHMRMAADEQVGEAGRSRGPAGAAGAAVWARPPLLLQVLKLSRA